MPAVDPSTLSRADWVNLRLLQSFLRTTTVALYGSGALLVLMVAILASHTQTWQLALWVLAVLGGMALRHTMLVQVRRAVQGWEQKPQPDVLLRRSWAWLFTGASWAGCLLLLTPLAPFRTAFVCMVALVGVVGLSVAAHSSCLVCFQKYVNALCGSVVIIILGHMLGQTAAANAFNLIGLLGVLVLYWGATLVSGRHFHAMQRTSLETQFDNAELIASLTETTRAAMEAVQSKNRFIASTAHDLRQPVHALSLYADWLVTEPELVLQIAPKIVRSTKAVNELFNSLFDLAGMQSDTLHVNLADVDIATMLLDLELQYAPMALERGLKLRLRAHHVHVRTDAVLLQRLVGNLVSNALRNTHQGGVLIALRQRPSGWRIEVWDTGVGVAEAHQQAIFKEFYRVPTQGTEHGFGLGLAIVSRVSMALNTPVGMRSRTGQGSVFWVDLGADAELRSGGKQALKAGPVFAPSGWPASGF